MGSASRRPDGAIRARGRATHKRLFRMALDAQSSCLMYVTFYGRGGSHGISARRTSSRVLVDRQVWPERRRAHRVLRRAQSMTLAHVRVGALRIISQAQADLDAHAAGSLRTFRFDAARWSPAKACRSFKLLGLDKDLVTINCKIVKEECLGKQQKRKANAAKTCRSNVHVQDVAQDRGRGRAKRIQTLIQKSTTSRSVMSGSPKGASSGSTSPLSRASYQKQKPIATLPVVNAVDNANIVEPISTECLRTSAARAAGRENRQKKFVPLILICLAYKFQGMSPLIAELRLFVAAGMHVSRTTQTDIKLGRRPCARHFRLSSPCCASILFVCMARGLNWTPRSALASPGWGPVRQLAGV